MIDGQLAFPEEEPAEPWHELRVASTDGMVTLRRGGSQVDVVVWGNALPTLLDLWNKLAWAFCETGHGTIMTAEGVSLSADAFRAQTKGGVDHGAN
jgi:hypothetical protein